VCSKGKIGKRQQSNQHTQWPHARSTRKACARERRRRHAVCETFTCSTNDAVPWCCTSVQCVVHMCSRQAQGLFSPTIQSCAWVHSIDRTECRCHAGDGCHGESVLGFRAICMHAPAPNESERQPQRGGEKLCLRSSPLHPPSGTLKCPRADSARVRLSLRKWCARLEVRGECGSLGEGGVGKGGSVGVDPLNEFC
jgi:hypothetical protein